MSGLLDRMDLATSLRSVVLPAFGGDTIIPLCPLPMGEIRSVIRMAILLWLPLQAQALIGKMGVMSSKFQRFVAS